MTVKPSAGTVKPRLRFDKVAQRLVAQVQDALSADVPAGKCVLVTVTAPIRQPSKTAAEIEIRIREALRRGKNEIVETIHGNEISVRVAGAPRKNAPKVLGFVHNPDPGAAVALLDEAQEKMAHP